MKNVKLYLPFETDFINSDMHSELIDRYGARGLGVYFMVLMELRNHPGYRCGLSTLKGAARRCMADPGTLESVLCDFGLFEFQECGNRVLVSSVYINRVMQPFDENTGRFPSTASENTVTVEPPVHGMSTVTHRIILNTIEIKIKTKTTNTNTKAAAAANVVAVAVDAVDAVAGNAPPLTATPVPCRNKAPTPQAAPWRGRHPDSALPANSWWNHCADSRGKAPPRPRHGAVCPVAPRGGFRRKTAGPYRAFAAQPAFG